MKRITIAFLKRHEACTLQVHKFAKVFPFGAPVSLRSLEKAKKARIDWRWLIRFGDAEYRKTVAPIYAKYLKALVLIDTEYRKARDLVDVKYEALASIDNEYEKDRGSIEAEYWKARSPIYAKYWKDRDLVDAEYGKDRAPILIHALLRYKEQK